MPVIGIIYDKLFGIDVEVGRLIKNKKADGSSYSNININMFPGQMFYIFDPKPGECFGEYQVIGAVKTKTVSNNKKFYNDVGVIVKDADKKSKLILFMNPEKVYGFKPPEKKKENDNYK